MSEQEDQQSLDCGWSHSLLLENLTSPPMFSSLLMSQLLNDSSIPPSPSFIMSAQLEFSPPPPTPSILVPPPRDFSLPPPNTSVLMSPQLDVSPHHQLPPSAYNSLNVEFIALELHFGRIDFTHFRRLAVLLSDRYGNTDSSGYEKFTFVLKLEREKISRSFQVRTSMEVFDFYASKNVEDAIESLAGLGMHDLQVEVEFQSGHGLQELELEMESGMGSMCASLFLQDMDFRNWNWKWKLDHLITFETFLDIDLRRQRQGSPWPIDLPHGRKTVQLDSLDQESLVKFDATNNEAHGVKANRNFPIVSHSEKKNTRDKLKRNYRSSSVITLEVLQQYFGTSREEAAKSLGVSESTLKRICRERGIPRWPRQQERTKKRLMEVISPSIQKKHDSRLRCIQIPMHARSSPQAVALPDGEEMVNHDSSEQQSLLEFDVTNTRAHLVGANDICSSVSHLEKTNSRETLKRKRIIESVHSFEHLQQYFGSRRDDAAMTLSVRSHLLRKSDIGVVGESTIFADDMKSLLADIPSTSQPITTSVAPLPEDDFDLVSGDENIDLLDEVSDNEASVLGPLAFDLAVRQRSSPLVGVAQITQAPTLPDALMLNQVAPSRASTIDTRSIIHNARHLAASMLDNHIKNLLSETPIQKVLALGPKLQEIYDEISKLQINYSPLQNQIEKYMQNAATYISMQSAFAQGMTLELQTQCLTNVNQRLTHALDLENEGIERVRLLQSNLGSISAKKTELLKALEQLDEQSQRLEASISTENVEIVERQAIISSLREEQATIEATEVIRSEDIEVANKLENLLKLEQIEIQSLSWLP